MQHVAMLIDRYRRLAATHAAQDYADRASVLAANHAADEMRSVALEVARAGPEAVRQFAALLEEPEPGGWAAHHLVEQMEAEPELVSRALALIERRSRGDSATALGERMWLQAWRAKGVGSGSRAPEA